MATSIWKLMSFPVTEAYMPSVSVVKHLLRKVIRIILRLSTLKVMINPTRS